MRSEGDFGSGCQPNRVRSGAGACRRVASHDQGPGVVLIFGKERITRPGRMRKGHSGYTCRSRKDRPKIAFSPAYRRVMSPADG